MLSFLSAKAAGFAAALLALSAPAACAQPEWWSTALTAAPKQNNAAAAMGQAMHMVKTARDRMNEVYRDRGGAGDEIEALLIAYDPAWNFRAIRLGQLKHLSAPFWRRLQELGAPGVAAFPARPFPWTADKADDRDGALAALGQVKAVFAFEIPEPKPKALPPPFLPPPDPPL